MRHLKRLCCTVLILFVGIGFTGAHAAKNAPEHYINKGPVNSDPDYIPGDYPAPDVNAALDSYDDMVDNLDPRGDVLDVMREEGDEITWTAIKNKTASVLGYFRTYDGYISFKNGKFSKAELLISVNSLDSAIPGRDNRIKSIFFESMKPHLGTAVLVLDKIKRGTPYFSSIQNGAAHRIRVGGYFTYGSITLPVSVVLELVWDNANEILSVETVEPLELLISDLKLGENVSPLMLECNHKSMGNLVKITCKLRFE